MTKFIKVTEQMTGGDCKILLLNTAYISHVQSGVNGKDTHIRMNHVGPNGNLLYYFVKESVEQIEILINTDSTKAHVIMTADEKYYNISGAAK